MAFVDRQANMSIEPKPLTERFVKNLYWIWLVVLFSVIAISSGIEAALIVFITLWVLTVTLLMIYSE